MSIVAPPVVTGSDPTSVPVAAAIAPAVAALLTVSGYRLAATAEGD